jgi:hypothetical protein
VADVLSRRDVEGEASAAALTVPSFHLFGALRREFIDIPELQLLKQEVASGTMGDAWQVVDDLVMVRGMVFVSPGSPALQDILPSAHILGHEGMEKTLHRLRVDFHVSGACGGAQVHAHVLGMPAEQDGTAPPDGAAAAAGNSFGGVGRHHRRLHRGAAEGQRELGHHRGGPLFQIRILPSLEAPLHSDHGRPSLLQHHRQAQRRAKFHRQR